MKTARVQNAALRSNRQESLCCAMQQPAGGAMLRYAASGANGLMALTQTNFNGVNVFYRAIIAIYIGYIFVFLWLKTKKH
jgi:hypothetical protein